MPIGVRFVIGSLIVALSPYGDLYGREPTSLLPAGFTGGSRALAQYDSGDVDRPHPKRRKRRKRKRKKRRKPQIRQPVAAESPPPAEPLISAIWESEVGYEWLRNVADWTTRFDRPFLRQKLLLGVGDGSLSARAAYRILGDTAENLPRGSYRVDLRALTLETASDHVRIAIGLQEVAWGESFGFPPLDVVTPYAYDQYYLADPAFARIPVAMVNTLITAGSFTLQGIYTPLPRRSPIIAPISAIPAREPEPYVAGRDAEYGGKIGFLAASGFDLNLYYFKHWTRLPVYRLVQAPPLMPELELSERQVETSGLSFSQAFNSIVVRGDLATHNEVLLPTPDLTQVESTAQQQISLGLDHTTSSGQTTTGLTLQAERWIEKPTLLPKDHTAWAALRFRTQIFSALFEPELMAWHGLGNRDAWYRFKLTWNVAEGLALSSSGDYMISKGDGNVLYFSEQKMVYTRLSYRF